MPWREYLTQRFDRPELAEALTWDMHLAYPALTPFARTEAAGYGPGMSGAFRTGELPGTGWNSQSFADNPSPADLLRLGGRVPTGADSLLGSLQRNVVM